MNHRAFSPRGFDRGLAVGGVCLLLCMLGGRVFADASAFAEPVLVSDGMGNATQTTTGLDINNNAYVGGVINDRIHVTFIGLESTFEMPIPYEGQAQGAPDFETNSIGTTFLSYTQISPGGPVQGREIYLTDNQGGGGFGAPLRLTDNPVDDYAPRLVLDLFGEPHLTWLRRVGSETQVFYWHAGLLGGNPVQVVLGDSVHLFVANDGVAHIVFSKDNDLFYVNNVGGFFSPPNQRAVTTTPLDPESSASVGGDPDNNIFVAYESQNILYYTSRVEGGDFVPSRVVDSGGVLDPRMKVGSFGQIFIGYAKQGDLFYVLGRSESLNAPESLIVTPGSVETQPSTSVDRLGNIHCSFILDSDIYYTHNVGPPTAQFSATLTQGAPPLTVQFADLSSGAIQRWDWDFGDGSAIGHEQNPVHVYEASGAYSVRLTVFTAGAGEAEEFKEDFINVPTTFERMEIRDQRVYPGQQEVWFPVLGWWSEPIEGYQIMATYPPSLRYERFEIDELTVYAGGDGLDFYQVNDLGNRLEVGVAVDISPPIDRLPPSSNKVLIAFIFDVRQGAPQGAQVKVDLVNNREISSISNVYSVHGQRKVPRLMGSTVTIEFVQPPFFLQFVRGDVDGSEDHDISDAISLLAYLFSGGPAPSCLDRADSDDSGELDLSDPIYLLNFLFVGGAILPPPFPNFGLDPTEDELPVCLLGAG